MDHWATAQLFGVGEGGELQLESEKGGLGQQGWWRWQHHQLLHAEHSPPHELDGPIRTSLTLHPFSYGCRVKDTHYCQILPRGR